MTLYVHNKLCFNVRCYHKNIKNDYHLFLMISHHVYMIDFLDLTIFLWIYNLKPYNNLIINIRLITGNCIYIRFLFYCLFWTIILIFLIHLIIVFWWNIFLFVLSWNHMFYIIRWFGSWKFNFFILFILIFYLFFLLSSHIYI